MRAGVGGAAGASQGLKWGSGAISTAEFSGVLLKDLLRLGGLEDDDVARDVGAEHVQFEAIDKPYDGVDRRRSRSTKTLTLHRTTVTARRRFGPACLRCLTMYDASIPIETTLGKAPHYIALNDGDRATERRRFVSAFVACTQRSKSDASIPIETAPESAPLH